MRHYVLHGRSTVPLQPSRRTVDSSDRCSRVEGGCDYRPGDLRRDVRATRVHEETAEGLQVRAAAVLARAAAVSSRYVIEDEAGGEIKDALQAVFASVLTLERALGEVDLEGDETDHGTNSPHYRRIPMRAARSLTAQQRDADDEKIAARARELEKTCPEIKELARTSPLAAYRRALRQARDEQRGTEAAAR